MDDEETKPPPGKGQAGFQGTAPVPIVPVPGDVLVAGIGISDVFSGSVVLVLGCDEQGALGVVLNRLSTVSLRSVLPSWAPLASPPAALYCGGPVSTDGVICVARLEKGADEPPGWRRVFDNIGLLDLDTPIELVRNNYPDMRFFIGYAGWGPGQLWQEMSAGLWHVVPHQRDDIFGSHPDGMWRRTLRRARNDAAFFSTWTQDPQLN